MTPTGPPPPLIYAPPHAPYICVAHLDADALVVDKPCGLLAVPGKGAHLADCVAARADAATPGALIVHRIDMDTAGLMLLARNKRAQRIPSGQFEKRLIKKRYIADLWGAPPAEEGEVDLPLRADWPNRPRQMVCHIKGKPSLTKWKVIAQTGPVTRVELTPVTGRSHQLRLHMASLGCPILGDPIYATGDALSAAPHLALTAAEIAWRCPADGAWRQVAKAPPAIRWSGSRPHTQTGSSHPIDPG